MKRTFTATPDFEEADAGKRERVDFGVLLGFGAILAIWLPAAIYLFS
jgi:hypothetical protein